MKAWNNGWKMQRWHHMRVHRVHKLLPSFDNTGSLTSFAAVDLYCHTDREESFTVSSTCQLQCIRVYLGKLSNSFRFHTFFPLHLMPRIFMIVVFTDRDDTNSVAQFVPI